ncbi:uncharacterized protein LOC134178975 [Corticium candelabrum]|uniref:uncharacterized protein LOC134178975 n=1 Tax=Corticium candelabrum TaxID=121492 RepID=UPI002E25282A|nr:uncharacterized protein LOC134178975 [Corticium candelabrum]
MAKAIPEYTFKLLMIGDGAVGKTSLVSRFVDDSFAPSYTSTIGIDYKFKLIELGGFKVKLQIWDTAGQERFRTLTSAYYRGAQGIALTYDMTRPDSFKSVSYWMASVDEYAPPGCIKILIANKADLYPDREVSMQEGRDQAQHYDMKYFEVSAKTGEGVTDAFMSIAQQVKDNAARHELRKAVSGTKVSNGVDLNSNGAQSTKTGCCR